MNKEDFLKMPAFILNISRNRYRDIGCTENGRVELKLGKQPYIHVNYAGPPDEPKKFICTQAPMEATIPDFWQMVAQESSRCILMLCNYWEGATKKLPKCAQKPAEEGKAPDVGTSDCQEQEQRKIRLAGEEPDPSGQGSPRAQLGDGSCRRLARGREEPHHRRAPTLNGLAGTACPRLTATPIELLYYVQKFLGHPVVVHCSTGPDGPPRVDGLAARPGDQVAAVAD